MYLYKKVHLKLVQPAPNGTFVFIPAAREELTVWHVKLCLFCTREMWCAVRVDECLGTGEQSLVG